MVKSLCCASFVLSVLILFLSFRPFVQINNTGRNACNPQTTFRFCTRVSLCSRRSSGWCTTSLGVPDQTRMPSSAKIRPMLFSFSAGCCETTMPLCFRRICFQERGNDCIWQFGIWCSTGSGLTTPAVLGIVTGSEAQRPRPHLQLATAAKLLSMFARNRRNDKGQVDDGDGLSCMEMGCLLFFLKYSITAFAAKFCF